MGNTGSIVEDVTVFIIELIAASSEYELTLYCLDLMSLVRLLLDVEAKGIETVEY